MHKLRVTREPSSKRCLLWIIGCAVLTVGGFYTGAGIFHITHSNATAIRAPQKPKAMPKNNHRLFHESVLPLELRGSYVNYFPMKTTKLRPYYQVASLVHITKNKVYQQLMIVKKRPKALSTLNKRHRKLELPFYVSKTMKRTHVQSYFKTLNADAIAGKIMPNDVVYDIQLKQTGRDSQYNPKVLNSYFGNSHPYIVPVKDMETVRLNFSDYGFTANNYNYRKITNQRAKQLLKRNGKIPSFFDGYAKLK